MDSYILAPATIQGSMAYPANLHATETKKTNTTATLKRYVKNVKNATHKRKNS